MARASPFSKALAGRRSPEPPVILVPGPHFVAIRAPATAGMPDAELAAHARLVLEGSAPFPDEQLARGHFATAGGDAFLVFAALRRKLAAEQAAWKEAGFVVPDFATWLPAGRAQPGVVVLETTQAVTALEYGSDGVLPQRVVSRPVPAEAAEEGIAAAREHVLARVVPGGRRVWRYRLGAVPCLLEGGKFFFDWQPLEGAPAVSASLSVAQLWAMDLRDSEFLHGKRRDYRWNGIAWNALLGIGVAAGLLLLGELVLVGGGLSLARLEARLKAQEPEVRQAENNHSISSRLAGYIDRKPQPLEMLDFVNNQRPASVKFRKVSIEGGAKLVIDCVTTNPAEVNEFEAALKRAAAVDSAEVRNNRANSFQLAVVFRPGFTQAKAAMPTGHGSLPAETAVAPQTVPVQP